MSSDYPLELLDPERFQEFCQALLVREFPGVQCLPVGQPDGGRDAYLLQHNTRGDPKLVIFQVKFRRKPSEISDPVQWLTEIADAEKEKIKRLLAAGAKAYYLMTNVHGTAHLDVGSIDRVQTSLSDTLGTNAYCMWRADICRRLDDAWNLKWCYPELMTGPDLIRYALERGLNEHATRRANAIRAFIRSQYSIDEKVKFKQVDLQNHLLDLFVDVPINDPRLFFDAHTGWGATAYERRTDRREADIGAASFLLRWSPRKKSAANFVLEGAPGQGKSTISQYVCQVHRMRLLERVDDIARIPLEHRSGGIELPIKADLRDFATWLSRANPFGTMEEMQHLQGWDKSLDSFLAALVRHHSGGVDFGVSDLHAVLSRSAVVLVLDGLDEVADVRRRAEVVSEITKGVERLGEIASALRVVVTSRPAAFANSPGLSRDVFTYLSLGDMSRGLISEYAEKWLAASHADAVDAASVRRILADKLGQPHIRDLARNPMQLAILLSLIHAKGASLPDKRTALYDSYIDRFFSREAEKSPVVRDNRDLLINIHRYVAWLLHSEVEASNAIHVRSSGAIEEVRLKSVVRDYLISDGRDPTLADALFHGVVERVVALVSRVQGTYEFEVQPLREYFAARHLYETAPYSPPGNERRGTKPDRFCAIARNFYWLNVTRFFAGCYSIGELASLVESIAELLEAPDFAKLKHPRVLTATLLGDWVFAQQNRSASAAAKFLTDDLSFRLLLAHTSTRAGDGQLLTIPKGSGGEQLVDRAFDFLETIPPADLACDIGEFLMLTGDRQDLLTRWREAIGRCKDEDVGKWLEYGRLVGCLAIAPFEVVTNAMDRAELNEDVVNTLLVSGRTDILEYDAAKLEFAVRVILSTGWTPAMSTRSRFGSSRPLTKLAAIANPYFFALGLRGESAASIDSPPAALLPDEPNFVEVDPPLVPSSEQRDKLLALLRNLEPLAQIPSGTWRTSLGPWSLLVEEITKLYGDRDVCFTLALLSSWVVDIDDKCEDCPHFGDAKRPLIRRVRHARLRTDAVKWWRESLRQSSGVAELARLCTIWITSGSRTTLQQTAECFDQALAQLPTKQWQAIWQLVQSSSAVLPLFGQIRRGGAGWEVLGRVSNRTKTLLATRFNHDDAEGIRSEILKSGSDLDLAVMAQLQSVALTQLGAKGRDPQPALEICRRLFAQGQLFEREPVYSFGMRREPAVKLAAAQQIMSNPERYPTLLIGRAERAFRRRTAGRTRPVLSIAKEEGWFSEGFQ